MEDSPIKICSKCRLSKQLDEFNLHRGTKDRLQPYCRECQKQANREYRRSFRELTSVDIGKRKAWNYVREAIISGKLPPLKDRLCSICMEPPQYYHHMNGYSKETALDVIPLCTICHGTVHYYINEI